MVKTRAKQDMMANKYLAHFSVVSMTASALPDSPNLKESLGKIILFNNPGKFNIAVFTFCAGANKPTLRGVEKSAKTNRGRDFEIVER